MKRNEQWLFARTVEAAKKRSDVSRTVEGQFSFALDSSAPAEIMYMPAGQHTIEARVDGEPKEIDVKVTAKTADVLQKDLEDLLGENVEPFLDFDHEGKASAAIPKRFKWVAGKGVYLELEWTKSGREKVEGKDYRYFSPAFNIGSDGEPKGLPESGAIGALTNNPAFRDMQRIAASRTKPNGDEAEPTDQQNMEKLKAALVKLGLISKDDADGDEGDMVDKMTKKVKSMQDDAESAKAAKTKAEDEKKEAYSKKEEAEAALAKLHDDTAASVVEAAITAGKIPGKDEDLKKYYIESYKANPEGTKKALAAIQTRGILRPVVTVDGKEREKSPEAVNGSADRKEVMAQRTIINKVRAANPRLNTDAVFAIAKEEYPEYFAEG